MLSKLSPYKLLIEIALIGSFALLAVWGIHSFLEAEQQKGYDKAVAEYQRQAAEAEKLVKEREKFLREMVAEAQAKGNEREQTIRDVAATGAAASAGLRDTLAHIRRTSTNGASVEALSNTVATLTTVFDDCQGKYREMAETADRHANDARTLTEAWPVTLQQPAK